MFNYETNTGGAAQPKRTLNKRVAFPVAGSTGGPTPGHAGSSGILHLLSQSVFLMMFECIISSMTTSFDYAT